MLDQVLADSDLEVIDLKLISEKESNGPFRNLNALHFLEEFKPSLLSYFVFLDELFEDSTNLEDLDPVGNSALVKFDVQVSAN